MSEAEQPKKKLTLWQIAEMAGTSKSTVSRVLTNDPEVSPLTRERVQRIIKEQGYRPNFFARGLRGGPTGQIGVLGRWMERGFIADVIQGIDDIAAEQGSHLLTSFAHSPEDYVGVWSQFTEARQVDGMILIAPPRELLSEKVEAQDMPLVLCACKASNNRKGWQHVDSVTFDNRTALEEVLQHLLDQGCKNLVHFQGSAAIYETIERGEIFTQFCSQHAGITHDVVKLRETQDEAYQMARDYIQQHTEPPDAFVCFNDSMALGVLHALRDLGIPVPAQTAVTGFDDLGQADPWGLTTIGVPGIRVGQECARLLFLRMNEKEDMPMARDSVVRLKAIFRESTNIVAARAKINTGV